MSFEAVGRHPVPLANPVGVAFKCSRLRGTMHVGLLYRKEDGTVMFGHMAGDEDVRNEPFSEVDGYHWSDCDWLRDPKLYELADDLARQVEKCARTTAVGYGPNPPMTAFDAQGAYACSDVKLGLTCATWVALVLGDAGYPVVEMATWRGREDDLDWWESTRRHLGERRLADLGRVEVGFRLRPDEAAVAAAGEDPPLRFEEAVERACRLRDRVLG